MKGVGSLSVLSLGPHQKVAPSQDPQSFQISSYWSQARWSFLLYRDSPWSSPNGCSIQANGPGVPALPPLCALPWGSRCPPIQCCGQPELPLSPFLTGLCSLSLTNSSPATPAWQRNSSPVLWERVWSEGGTGYTWGPWELGALWASYAAVQTWGRGAGLKEGVSVHLNPKQWFSW